MLAGRPNPIKSLAKISPRRTPPTQRGQPSLEFNPTTDVPLKPGRNPQPTARFSHPLVHRTCFPTLARLT
uniref:Uncharacterized protein n=1 Tax=Triticum urartu TaxID=4572 RepID=A0A8R7UVG8_TRIUA